MQMSGSGNPKRINSSHRIICYVTVIGYSNEPAFVLILKTLFQQHTCSKVSVNTQCFTEPKQWERFKCSCTIYERKFKRFPDQY